MKIVKRKIGKINITIRNYTYYTKTEFLRLLQKILFINNETYTA